MDQKLQSSVCNFTETDQVVVKDEYVKEEQNDYMIECQDEEKPFSELPCRHTPETDVAEDVNGSANEETHFAESKAEIDTQSDATCLDTLQTAVEIEVKIEQDEEELSNLGSKSLPL